ncbi:MULTISPECIES: IPT/TIG domain-containing protein [Sphingobacterium]|uniref:IPT/TIG domain-containing protein n=1 Tax=Sphingobacterium TaxID=28453 RepID=UPI0013DACCB9|nr:MULTISPECIES: IPT/TIG domain-containing protein [unclassified Sphingobacterium]
MSISIRVWFCVAFIVFFSACENKNEQFLPAPIIDTVEVSGTKLTLHVNHFNLYDRSKNLIKVDDQILSYEIIREKGNIFLADFKADVFDEFNFVRTVLFHNGFSETSKQIYSPLYPVILEISPKRAYPGDTITIDGNNLDFKEDLAVLFPTSSGDYVFGKIIYGDEYTLKVIVPENAVSGALLYRNRLGISDKLMGLLTTDLEIKVK